MKKGNVRHAGEKQLDELRIAVEKAVNKLRGRIDSATAQGWIGNSEALDRWAEQLVLLQEQEARTTATIVALNSVISIILPPTTGRPAEDFIRVWEEQYNPSDVVKYITRKARFTPTVGVTYRIPIIMGCEFSCNERSTANVRAEAARRSYRTLPFEAACMLREALSDEELKLFNLYWLTGMHDPILDSDRNSNLLGVDRHGDGRRVIAYRGHPDDRWYSEGGFAFLAPESDATL